MDYHTHCVDDDYNKLHHIIIKIDVLDDCCSLCSELTVFQILFTIKSKGVSEIFFSIIHFIQGSTFS